MANDVSYFKVLDDDTKYSFDDADAEVRITEENTRAEAAEGEKVAKAGDTMTGSLAIKDANIDVTATHTSNYWGTGYQYDITDKNGVDVGHIRPFCTSADLQGIYIETTREVNGATVYNYLRLAVDGSGNKKVHLTAAPWLEALGLESAAGDSGWQTLTLDSAFELYTSGFPARYRKIGKTVEVYGIVKPASEIAAGGTATIGTLPSGYRPPNQLTFLCQGSSSNKWLLTVGSDGNLVFGRYGASSNVAAGTNVWLPFNAMFFVS